MRLSGRINITKILRGLLIVSEMRQGNAKFRLNGSAWIVYVKGEGMPGGLKALLERLKWALVGNCVYWRRCPYFRRESYTCTHGGGNYCGFYRRLKEDDAKRYCIDHNICF